MHENGVRRHPVRGGADCARVVAGVHTTNAHPLAPIREKTAFATIAAHSLCHGHASGPNGIQAVQLVPTLEVGYVVSCERRLGGQLDAAIADLTRLLAQPDDPAVGRHASRLPAASNRAIVSAMPEPPVWVNDYAKLLASPAPDDWDRARSLKQAYIPSRLFRYRSPTSPNIKDIKDGTIWLAAPSDFNDPFDSAFSVDASSLLKATLRAEPRDWIERLKLPPKILLTLRAAEDPFPLLKELLAAEAIEQSGLQAAEQANTMLTKFLTDASTTSSEHLSKLLRSGIKVACFSETGTSLPLWAYYTDSHNGFCVEYNVSRLSRTGTALQMLHPVLYDSKRSALEVIMAGVQSQIHFWPHWWHCTNRRIGLTRGSGEWCILWDTLATEANGMAIAMPPYSLYFGNRMDPGHRRELQAIADAKKITTFDMIISAHRFELQPIQVRRT